MLKYAFILVVTFLIFNSCKVDPSQRLPSFNLLLPDSSTVFNTRDIPKDEIAVLIHFEADCVECQKQTESLLKNIDSFPQVKFYFLTTENFNRLDVFNVHYKLKNYPNILAGLDYDHFFPKFIKNPGTPLIAIYDKRKNLQSVFSGRAEIHELLTQIKKIQ